MSRDVLLPTATGLFPATVASSSSLLDEPVDYRDLKAWIEQQERDPQPLTRLQQRAIADLTRSLHPVSKRDWVSMLNTFTSIHGSMVEYPEPTGDFLQWTAQCFLGLPGETQPRVFPNSDAGFIPVDGIPTAPRFTSKKDAKQYAAKCCAEWLISAGYMTPEGRPRQSRSRLRKKFYTPPTAEAAANEAIAAAPLPNQTYNPSQNAFSPHVGPVEHPLRPPTTDDTALMPPPPLPAIVPVHPDFNPTSIPVRTTTTWPLPAAATPPLTDGEEDLSDDDKRPATVRVAELCLRLGFVVPQYHIKPSEGPDADPATTVASWTSSGTSSDSDTNKNTMSPATKAVATTAVDTEITDTPAQPAKRPWASDTESDGSLKSWSPTVTTATAASAEKTAEQQTQAQAKAQSPGQTKVPVPVPKPMSRGPFYDAYPDFGRDRIKVPLGLGRVTHVYGKKNAKQRVAEEVLMWLQMEERLREQAFEGLLETLEPVADETP